MTNPVVRKFEVRGPLGLCGKLEIADEFDCTFSPVGLPPTKFRWVVLSVQSPAELSQESLEEVEQLRRDLAEERGDFLDDEDDFFEEEDDEISEESTFATSRIGPWLTIHTVEGEIFGFEIVEELK